MVVDGREESEYGKITSKPIFSFDGKRIAYSVERSAMVVEGIKEGEQLLIAGAVPEGADSCVVVDGKEGKKVLGNWGGLALLQPGWQAFGLCRSSNTQDGGCRGWARRTRSTT